MIRLAAPHIDDNDVAAVERVLRSGHLVQGREVAAFEEELRTVVGSRHAIAVTNCTSALHLALIALGVKAGDKVIVPAFSWPATANVVASSGATPVFIDIDDSTFAMRPELLARSLREPGVKAVIPVHPFGEMADIAAIVKEAAATDVPVIEDAACALGAVDNGGPAGRWGAMGCYSFHPRKAITTGEGGAIVTEDGALARRLRMLRNHGLDPDAATPDFVLAGLNQRMTEFQAALGRTQLRKLDGLISERRRLARRYNDLLRGSGLVTPEPRSSSSHVFQSYVVLVPPELAAERNAIISRVRDAGVEVSIGTHHIPLLRWYRETFGYKVADFPVTDSVAARAITLPLHAYLTLADQDKVVEVLRAAVN